MSDVAIVGLVAALPPTVLALLAWLDHRRQIKRVQQTVEQTCAEKLGTAVAKLDKALAEIERIKRSKR